MTTPTAPFGEEEKQSSESVDFSIKTMRDDIIAAENNPALKKNVSSDKNYKAVDKKITQENPADLKANPFLENPPAQASSIAFSAPKQATSSQIIKQQSSDVVRQSELAKSSHQIIDVPTPTKTVSGNVAYKIILSAVVILIISILSAGAYYFWATRTPKQSGNSTEKTLEQPTNSGIPLEEEPVVISPSSEKYSSEKPNYLPLDLATTNPEDIKAAIVNVASEIKESSLQSPYEFIVVDANNTPVAFPIFATAAKLSLSQLILSSLGENFSIFFFKDGADVRLAISTTIANKTALSAELPRQEKTFAIDASLLFLNNAPETTTGEFKNGLYGNIPTRYLNLGTQTTLSIDYALLNDKFVVATSKNTLRAILDKYPQKTPGIDAATTPLSKTTLAAEKNAIPANTASVPPSNIPTSATGNFPTPPVPMNTPTVPR